MIANCGHDESFNFRGGKAGDQTGHEWEVRTWYNGKWSCVLRHPDKDVRETIASLAEKSARNDLIGYDQWERFSFWHELQKANYNPSAIANECEADCSAGVCAIAKATGFLLGRDKLKDILPSLTTSSMKSSFIGAGFKCLTDSKYRKSDAFLMRGDILLRVGHHTCINLSDGIEEMGELNVVEIKEGSKGKAVKVWQTILGISADGIFGKETLAHTRAFQKKNGLDVDGIVGKNTWKAGFESL